MAVCQTENDDELTDAWLAGERFAGGVSHDQHLRIAWVLIRRHGTDEAEQHLVAGTRRACEVHRVPVKFEEALTRRWARAITDLIDRDGLVLSLVASLSPEHTARPVGSSR